MLDFDILDIGVAEDLCVDGRPPVYRAVLRSHYDQTVVIVDTRCGSWATAPSDQNGYRHVMPDVASVLQDRVRSRAQQKESQFAGLANNPFMKL